MAKILFSKAIETMRDSSTSGLVLQYQNGSTEKDTEWGIPGKLKRAYQDYHTRYAHKISTPDRTRTYTSETPDPKSGASTNFATGAKACAKLQIFFLIQDFLPKFFLHLLFLMSWRANSMMVSRSLSRSLSVSCMLQSGSIPNSVLLPCASYIGHAENLTVQPLGSSLEKGSPAPPPVLSPTVMVLGQHLMYFTNSLAAL